MLQKIKLPVLSLTTLGFTLIACQKQQEAAKLDATPAQKASKLGFTLNAASTKCRIPIDDAALYTQAFRDKMEKEEGKKAGTYTVAYTIPAEGLLDLFTTAEQQGKKLKAIRTYRAIRDGHETLVYVGVDENNNDLITNADYGINNIASPTHPPVEDQVNGCPGTCLTAPNVLTGK